jgi:hypothetical protein
MSEAKMRGLFNSGLTYDEIAEINERSEGWRPSRSGVKRKYDRMGMPPRRHSNKNLIPWTIQTAHHNDRFRHMLQAESRARDGLEISETDRKLTSMLHDLLFGRGKLMVVGYHPDVGFYLAERGERDADIIREPVKRSGFESLDEEIA